MKSVPFLSCIVLLATSAAAPRSRPPDRTLDALTTRTSARLVEAALDVPMVIAVNTASVISEFTVDLAANTLVNFAPLNKSANSDPVLHLLNANGKEVAVSPTSLPGVTVAAPLSFTTSTAGQYRLLVRARSSSSAGVCDVLMNGVVWRTQVAFGGWQTTLSQLRAKETLETVKVPNGAIGTHLLLVLKSNGVGIEMRGYGNGTAGASAVALPSALGNRAVIVGVNRWGVPGAARLIRNDAGIGDHDADQDGLGVELEKKIGTCSTLNDFTTGPDGSEFDCSKATDARDTDGDGISDRWEVLGRKDVVPHQALPLWGADPRHKDLFVEFDFMGRSVGEAEAKMTPASARIFAAYYGDRVGTVSALRQAYHAAILRNPDGKPGISAHLDIGVTPSDPRDATTFGDWGGHNYIPAVMNAQGNWVGFRYQDAWNIHLQPARRGIFRHSASPATGGGSNDLNHLSFSAGINEPWVLAHESGHAQGLGHSGPSFITGDVDPNCKPNYQSMMNYAYQSVPSLVGFGDGLATASLNNVALKEWQGVLTGNGSYLSVLRNVFGYYIDSAAGHVDWNRDGEFAPTGTTVRAYANYSPVSIGGCEFTKYNPMNASGPAATVVSPAIARIGGRTYVFWAGAGGVSYTWTSSSLVCPVPDDSPCAAWNGSGTLPIAGAQGIDVVRIGSGVAARLLLVAVTSTGKLYETRLRVSGTNEIWTTPGAIDLSESVTGEPSLAAMDPCSVTLAYKDAAAGLQTRRATCGSNWSWPAPQPGLGSNGVQLILAAQASPSLSRGYVPSRGTSNLLLGAFVSASDNGLRLYTQDIATARWQLTPDLEMTVQAKGRPAMAWVPFGKSDYPGRLYLLYRQPSDGAYRWMWSYVRVAQDPAGNVVSKQGRIGLNGWFRNVSYRGAGFDFLYEQGIDSNLRSVSVYKEVVTLEPKSDGILDFTYLNYDDWQVHRVGLCKHVVNPGGTVDNPIKCPAKDW